MKHGFARMIFPHAKAQSRKEFIYTRKRVSDDLRIDRIQGILGGFAPSREIIPMRPLHPRKSAFHPWPTYRHKKNRERVCTPG
ncbi:MAG: hypothetical protein Q7P63_09555 [Verrucomicrobiota bacterium JB022]|nr:hypothetical protein [Verrucomicrobiota bacterium JB022]